MPFLESKYFETLLNVPLETQLEARYRHIFEMNTGLKVSHFVDGFLQHTSGEWFLLAELSDGSFGVYVEIEEFYESSTLFEPLHIGIHVYFPCKREAAERVLVEALLDDEEEYSHDLAYHRISQGMTKEAEMVKNDFMKSQTYLTERLNGDDEESARITTILNHFYD